MKILKFPTIVFLFAGLTISAFAQDRVSRIKDLETKVTANTKITYFDLAKLVFPTASRIWWVGSGDPKADFPSTIYKATTSVPLRALTSAPKHRQFQFTIDSADGIVIGEDKKHLALLIEAKPSKKSDEKGFFVVAFFAVSPKPRLLAAYELEGGRKPRFGMEFIQGENKPFDSVFEEETASGGQIWFSWDTSDDAGTEARKNVLIELKRGIVTVILDKLPLIGRARGCGFQKSFEVYFGTLLACGQEVFSKGRAVKRISLYETWSPTSDCGNPKAGWNRVREREIQFYWNQRLARYEIGQVAEDDYRLTGDTLVDPKSVDLKFAGFETAKALRGKPVLFDEVYEVSLLGGREYWDFRGKFDLPNISQSFQFNFGSTVDSNGRFDYMRVLKSKTRVDVRFVITRIERSLTENGWEELYDCEIIAAAERQAIVKR